jgi:hypothetical protein
MFEARAEFFVAVAKARWNEGGGRLLLGDNTGQRAVMLLPIKFQCVLDLDFSWTSQYMRVRLRR